MTNRKGDMTLTREPACRVKFCPAPRDPDWHRCWCGQDKIEHHHVESRGMGGSKLKKNVVALCHTHHEAVTLHECFDIVTDFGWSKSYTYFDTDGTVLHQRKLEAESAAAEGRVRATISDMAPEVESESSAAAPSASGKKEEDDGLHAGNRRSGDSDMGVGLSQPRNAVGERNSDNSAPANGRGGDARPLPVASGESRAAEPLVRGALPGLAPSAAPPSFNLDIWREEGRKLAQMGLVLRESTSAWQFLVGDWFNEGEQMLGEEAYGHIDEVGFSSVALRQYSWVAAKVAADTRVADLPWTYHRAVAALEPPKQREWLEKAQEEHMSSKGLYQAIHGEKPRAKRWSIEELRERYDSYAVGENRHGHGYIGCFLDWLETG